MARGKDITKLRLEQKTQLLNHGRLTISMDLIQKHN